MEIRIKFEGGPLDGEYATTDRLQDVKVFLPPTDRIVLMYKRNPMGEELVYVYDLDLSTKATTQYDKVVDFLQSERAGVLTFLPPAPPVQKTQPFNDQYIIDDTENDNDEDI